LVNSLGGQILGISNGNCFIISQKDNFIPGSNFINVRSRVGTCFSKLSQPMVITLNTPPDIKAEAIEDDIIVCEGEAARLTSRFGPPLVNLQWKALHPSNVLSDETAITTLISGLQPGRNTVVLNYSIVGCPSFSQKIINLYADFTPNVVNDTFILEFPKSLWLDVLLNDRIPERANITIVTPPLQGNANVSDGGIRFTPDPRFPEEQQIRYRVCADFCDELCQEGVIFIRYQDDIECRPPTIITPNQDGINDYFIVPCLGTGKYPNNSLVVFNEWGQEVYYAKPYTNDWGGTFGNNDLPVGTYFYVFQTDAESKPINGFLILQR
jgi:gliding motility-associated-like protein